jgi:hypothetical protein
MKQIEMKLLPKSVQHGDGFDSPLLSPRSNSPTSLNLDAGSHTNHFRGEPSKQPTWESFTYDPWYSAVYESYMYAKTTWDSRKVTALRWVLNFCIGTAIALVAVTISYCTHQLTSFKFEFTNILIGGFIIQLDPPILKKGIVPDARCRY